MWIWVWPYQEIAAQYVSYPSRHPGKSPNLARKWKKACSLQFSRKCDACQPFSPSSFDTSWCTVISCDMLRAKICSRFIWTSRLFICVVRMTLINAEVSCARPQDPFVSVIACPLMIYHVCYSYLTSQNDAIEVATFDTAAQDFNPCAIQVVAKILF